MSSDSQNTHTNGTRPEQTAEEPEVYVPDPEMFIPENDGFDPDSDEFEQDTDGFDADVDGFDADVDGCDADVDGFDADVDGCDADVDGFDADVDGCDADVDGCDADLDGCDEDLDGCDAELQELDSESDGLVPAIELTGCHQESWMLIDLTMIPDEVAIVRPRNLTDLPRVLLSDDSLLQNRRARNDLIKKLTLYISELRLNDVHNQEALNGYNDSWSQLIDTINKMVQGLDSGPFFCESITAEALSISMMKDNSLLSDRDTAVDCDMAINKVVKAFNGMLQENQKMARKLFEATLKEGERDDYLKAIKLNANVHSMINTMMMGYRNRLFQLIKRLDEDYIRDETITNFKAKIAALNTDNKYVYDRNTLMRSRIVNHPAGRQFINALQHDSSYTHE